MSGEQLRIPPVRPGSSKNDGARVHPLKMMPLEFSQQSKRSKYGGGEYTQNHNDRDYRYVRDARTSFIPKGGDSRSGTLDSYIDSAMWCDPWIDLYADLPGAIRNSKTRHLSEQEAQRVVELTNKKVDAKRRVL
jgi:hypothetical protein